jgi:hypothetical protein
MGTVRYASLLPTEPARLDAQPGYFEEVTHEK